MATFPPALDKQAEIEALVSDILREMSPDVVRIRFDFHEDWSGDPGVFFRVLLSDALDRDHFLEVARRVRNIIWERVDFLTMGFPYSNFRKEGEQAVLRSKDWE
jgi:hypothetical protein